MTFVYKVWDERKRLQETLAAAYAAKDGKTVRATLKRLQQLRGFGF